MPENLKLVASTPPRQTMVFELEIGPDALRIGGGKLIPRPPHISRDRWLAFWKALAARGLLTPQVFDETARFIGLPPFPRANLPSNRKRGKQTPPKP
jgi:hypothetical protein